MVNESDSNGNRNASEDLSDEAQARRAFLKSAGKFAAVTPPAITFLLSTSMDPTAIAASGGRLGRGASGGRFPGRGATGGLFPGGGQGGKRFK